MFRQLSSGDTSAKWIGLVELIDCGAGGFEERFDMSGGKCSIPADQCWLWVAATGMGLQIGEE